MSASPPRPSRAIPDRLDHLTVQEFSRLFVFAVRARIAVGLSLGLVLGLVWATGQPVAPWRLLLLGSAVVVPLATGLRDLPHLRTGRLPPEKIIGLLATILYVQSVIIVLTGGLYSPFVVILPAVSLVVGLGTGQVRAGAMLIGAEVGLVGLLAADAALGPGRVLASVEFPGMLPGRGGPGFPFAMATLLTIALLIPLVVGLLSRGAVERAVAIAREAQAETVATMHDRNRELWALSGAVAHELKNPLASIRGLAGLLARPLEPDSTPARRMAVLREEVERMGTIITEFLEFSRPLTPMTQRQVDPAVIVERVSALHRPLAAQRSIRLRAEARHTAPVTCDPRKIGQVLANLLHNAIDASAPGTEVWLRVLAHARGVAFEVRDHGSGLDPEIRGRLFRPGATTKPQGNGIGLAVARAIAEQHGGTLELHEHPEGGCRATLVVPSTPPPPSPAVEPSPTPPAAPEPP